MKKFMVLIAMVLGLNAQSYGASRAAFYSEGQGVKIVFKQWDAHHQETAYTAFFDADMCVFLEKDDSLFLGRLFDDGTCFYQKEDGQIFLRKGTYTLLNSASQQSCTLKVLEDVASSTMNEPGKIEVSFSIP